jgi:hypothetical protein
VYGGSGGERLLARCGEGADEARCTVARDGAGRRFQLRVVLDLPGEARAVLFVGPGVPATTGSLTQDLEAAAAARIEVVQRPPTQVR